MSFVVTDTDPTILPSNTFTTAGVDGVAVSSTTTYYGKPSYINYVKDVSFQLVWTGTPTGTFTIQVSNLPSPNLATDTDWTTLTLASPITQPAGAAGNEFVDLAGLPGVWARPKYVNASGSGTINGYVAGNL